MSVQRVFAHEIVYGGRVYKNHVIELDCESGRVRVYPFEREIHSTTYYNGRIEVEVHESRLMVNPTTAVQRPGIG